MHNKNSFSFYRKKERYMLFLYALPFILLVIVFNYLPLHGWIYSLYNYKPGNHLFETDFVGLKNFTDSILFDKYLITVIRNTVVLSLINILLTPVPVIFAILLSELNNRHFKRLVQTTVTIPFFISWIVVFSLFFALFSSQGMVYQFLTAVGFADPKVNILGNSDYTWVVQSLFTLWKNMGYHAIIYFAALSSIDIEQYCAARMDGAGRFQLMIYITLPGILPTFFVLLLLTVANIMTVGFDQYFIFYNPLVASKIEVLDYYIYTTALKNNDFPYATAIGIYKTLISIILLFSVNMFSKKIRGKKLF